MPTYIVLSDWTDQGVANFEQTVDRYDTGVSQLEALGVRVKERFWTLGDHDMVSIIDAPNDEMLAAALLKLASLGNFRTTTLRAFSADEMRAVIAKVG
ncbi:MAG: GYD domain-containing protein [Solirubrobacterales bacterium]|nr:GYD domain-containing protein [Solirubrobacterales bacterium]